MTKEDKELLLEDLCARFAYNIIVLSDVYKTFDGGAIGKLIRIEEYCGSKHQHLIGQKLFYIEGCLTPSTIEEIRPYLRPMSSMTEEEKKEFHHIASLQRNYIGDDMFYTHWHIFDWLNARHFDYRGLIEKNLALDCTGLHIYD